MALVNTPTFRLVGTVDARQIVEEIADSDPQSIVGFVVSIVAEVGNPDFAKELGTIILTMEFEEWEEGEEEEEDVLGLKDEDE